MEEDDTDFQEALGLGQDQEDDYVDGAADGEEAAGIDVDGDQDMGRQGEDSPGEPQPIHRASSEQEDRLAGLQRKLMDSLVEANKWRSAFKEVAALVAGGHVSGAREPDIQVVVESVGRLKRTAQSMGDELRELRRREAALQIALADRNLEVAELRRELAAGWVAGEPHVLQLRQLLLDPAVNREYGRMRAELEEAQKEAKRLQEELAVAHFSQESKVGRQLMAKCRALADENEEMGRELAEGKAPQLEAQLVLARTGADELRGLLAELSDHCLALNEENEGLTRELAALRRKVAAAEPEGMDVGGPGPPGPYMGGGPGPGGRRDMGHGPGGPGGYGPPMGAGPGGFRGGRGGRGGYRGGGRAGGPGGGPGHGMGPPGMGMGGGGGPPGHPPPGMMMGPAGGGGSGGPGGGGGGPPGGMQGPPMMGRRM